MPCHAPRKKKETVLPPGPFYTVECIPSPLHETRYKIRGGKKKPQPSESLVHFDGRAGGVGIFDGTFFISFFMIDRTGGATTVHTREVPRYLCIYVPGRYGTLSLCLALPWEVLDLRLLSHIDTLLFLNLERVVLLR